MRAVVQRVSQAAVTVEQRVVGEIGKGFVVLLGVSRDDNEQDAAYLCDKILNLRVFDDEEGKLNLSLLDVRADLLVVSQFTLYGDCRKGRRPNFTESASAEQAKSLYETFLRLAQDSGLKVATGQFQAVMDVAIHNDGPVTLLLDSKRNF